MKQITILLTAVLMLSASMSFAGGKKGDDKFTGTIKFKISTEGREITSQEQTQMPTESIYYFSGDLERMDNVTPMGSVSMITNTLTKEFTMLFDQMGQKMFITIPSEDMKKAEALKEKDTTEVKPEYKMLEGTKTIAGYSCKKGSVTVEETTIEFYYTEDIKAEQKEFEDAPGYIMYYEVNIPNDELVLVYQATEVITKKPKKKVFAVTSEYDEMSEAYKKNIRQSMGLDQSND